MAPLHNVGQIEKDIFKLRWIALVGGLLGLVFGGQSPSAAILGWAAVSIGLAYNVGVGYVLYRHGYSPYISYVTAFLDAALLSLYIASLPGPIYIYASLYVLSVTSVAMRLRWLETLSIGALDCLFYVAALASSAVPITNWRLQIALPCGSIVLVAAFLGYFIHVLGRSQQAKADRTDQLEKRLTELAILQEVNAAVHNLKAGDTLQNIVEVCTKVLGFERAALYMVTDEGTDSEKSFFSARDFAQAGSEPGGLPTTFPPRLDDEMFAEAIQQNRPFALKDSEPGGSPHSRNWIVVPLSGADEPIGVLIVDRGQSGPDSDGDLDMLSSLASSAALAIENSQLHNRVQRMANLDGLTDLHNHRYFQESLRAAVHEGKLDGKSVSLVMVELDKFKLYNDTYGHQRGDRALKSIAHALEASVRHHEAVTARYGGDEFMVILPGLDKEQGIEVAREMRQWIGRLTTAEMSQYDLPGLKASIGVATFPDDADNASDLIDAVDQAMYMVKRSGGDAVCGVVKSDGLEAGRPTMDPTEIRKRLVS